MEAAPTCWGMLPPAGLPSPQADALENDGVTLCPQLPRRLGSLHRGTAFGSLEDSWGPIVSLLPWVLGASEASQWRVVGSGLWVPVACPGSAVACALGVLPALGFGGASVPGSLMRCLGSECSQVFQVSNPRSVASL